MTAGESYELGQPGPEGEPEAGMAAVEPRRDLFPFCVVWTPIPLLTWLFPIVGHMGIATSAGVIRDFAGPYVVGEGRMAFGRPVKYWRLKPWLVRGGEDKWDAAVKEASDVYSGRVHNLFCDNCHSHVALALNMMEYDGSHRWNMVKLCLLACVHSRYVGWWAVGKTWLPFCVVVCVMATVILLART